MEKGGRYGNIREVGIEDIVKTGLSLEEAQNFHQRLKDAITRAGADPRDVWKEITEHRLLQPSHPHHLHQLVYYSVYSDWDASSSGPPPYWFPSLTQSKHTTLGRVMEVHGPKLLGNFYQDPITSFSLFQKFSAQRPEVYWSIVLQQFQLKFHKEPNCILDTTDKTKHGGRWLPGAVLNIAECCLLPSEILKKQDDSIAVVWRDEGFDDSPVNSLTLKELRDQVMLVANALDVTFSKDDTIAIDMPMTVTAVIIYLAIILSGCIVVSIADSFAAKEIATRLRVSKAKGILLRTSL